MEKLLKCIVYIVIICYINTWAGNEAISEEAHMISLTVAFTAVYIDLAITAAIKEVTKKREKNNE